LQRVPSLHRYCAKSCHFQLNLQKERQSIFPFQILVLQFKETSG
jgi:hypothetical protein